MTGSNCLQCGHQALMHHTSTASNDGKQHYGQGPCWSPGWSNCRCKHYVGRDKMNAAVVLAAHGLGTWDGL